MRTIMTYAQEKAEEKRNHGRPLFTYTFVSVAGMYLIALILAAAFCIWVLPRIDAANNPILDSQLVVDVEYTADEKRLCWAWEFTKVRQARASSIGYNVQDRDGDVAPLVPYRQDTGLPFDARGIEQRKPGRHRIPLCAIMPDGIESPWVVTGHIDYETSRWWKIRGESPPIVPRNGRTTPGQNG